MSLTRKDLTKAELKKYPSIKLSLQYIAIKTEEDAMAALKPLKMMPWFMMVTALMFAVPLIGYAIASIILFGNIPWISFPLGCLLIYFSVRSIRFNSKSIPRMIKVYMNEEMGGSVQ